MVFCTIEEAWGNHFLDIKKNINEVDYKNINYNNINYDNIDLNKLKNQKKNHFEKTKKIIKKNLQGGFEQEIKKKIKCKKLKGGKKKLKAGKKKLKGGNIISDEFDIFYYIIIGILLLVLVDTFYKLGKKN